MGSGILRTSAGFPSERRLPRGRPRTVDGARTPAPGNYFLPRHTAPYRAEVSRQGVIFLWDPGFCAHLRDLPCPGRPSWARDPGPGGGRSGPGGGLRWRAPCAPTASRTTGKTVTHVGKAVFSFWFLVENLTGRVSCFVTQKPWVGGTAVAPRAACVAAGAVELQHVRRPRQNSEFDGVLELANVTGPVVPQQRRKSHFATHVASCDTGRERP